jgi:hypothetical protein
VEAEVNAWLASNPNITVKDIKQSLRAKKRSLCRYLMVETTAAHSSLRQQKSTLANRSSPGQPITTNNKKLGSV